MNKLVSIIFLNLLFMNQIVYSQVSCNKMLQDAKKEDNYLLAINKINAARRCNPKLAKEADNLTISIFKKVEKLKIRSEKAQEEAVQAKNKAELAKKQTVKHKEHALKFLRKTDSINTITKKVIDALYFYDDSISLAYNNNRYGYINKKGEPVIHFKYESATPFNEYGYAEVEDFIGGNLLIDTSGKEYKLAKSIEDINEDTEAIYNIDSISIEKLEEPKDLYFLNLSKVDTLHLVKLLDKHQNLSYLELSRNDLNNFPKQICLLNNLRALSISFNNIEQIPTCISNLKNLEILDISFNKIKYLPDNLNQLTNLKRLSAGFNEISELPNVEGLTNLKNLQLFKNKIIKLPNEIGKLTSLKSLNLISNKIHNLPNSFSELKNLSSLSLSDNNLMHFPNEILHLKNLININLKANNIRDIPFEINDLAHLQTLNLSENPIINAEPLGAIKSLKKLDLNYTKIKNFPKSFSKLIFLEHLGLKNSEILNMKGIEWDKMIHLKELNLVSTPVLEFDKSFNLLSKNCKLYIVEEQQIENLEKINTGRFDSLLLNYYNSKGNYNKVIDLLDKANPSNFYQLFNSYLETEDYDNAEIYFLKWSSNFKDIHEYNLNINELIKKDYYWAYRLHLKKCRYIIDNKLLLENDSIESICREYPFSFEDYAIFLMSKEINLYEAEFFLDHFSNSEFTDRVIELKSKANSVKLKNTLLNALIFYFIYDKIDYELALIYYKEKLQIDPNALSWNKRFLIEELFRNSKQIYSEIINISERKLKENYKEFVVLEQTLPILYILNNDWKKAKKIYKKWKGKSFPNDDRLANDIFLQDIADLEAAGITRKDFAKAKNLLKNE